MSMKREDRRCGNCVFFDSDDDTCGECRIRHPVVVSNAIVVADCESSGGVASYFPVVGVDSWCGDGMWERHSDITNRVELYCWVDDELTYREMYKDEPECD